MNRTLLTTLYFRVDISDQSLPFTGFLYFPALCFLFVGLVSNEPPFTQIKFEKSVQFIEVTYVLLFKLPLIQVLIHPGKVLLKALYIAGATRHLRQSRFW